MSVEDDLNMELTKLEEGGKVKIVDKIYEVLKVETQEDIAKLDFLQ